MCVRKRLCKIIIYCCIKNKLNYIDTQTVASSICLIRFIVIFGFLQNYLKMAGLLEAAQADNFEEGSGQISDKVFAFL